jgi:hypothetical protein
MSTYSTKPGPDFFILGAPKCGTSSLWVYLGQHPNIFMCVPKEPHFFCDDLAQVRQRDNLPDYLALFDGKEVGPQLGGEASAWSLYSQHAVTNILEYKPDAKLIAMVRNPVELVQSLHSQFVYNLSETNKNFEDAWALRDDSSRPAIMRYEDACKLGRQIERLLDTVPSEQVKVILFDDFSNNAQSIYHETVDFLGLPKHSLAQYETFNSNKKNRSDFLAKFVNETPKPVLDILNYFKKITGVQQLGIGEKLREINMKEFNRPKADSGIQQELKATFKDDILLLSRILDRDLSYWLK